MIIIGPNVYWVSIKMICLVYALFWVAPQLAGSSVFKFL